MYKAVMRACAGVLLGMEAFCCWFRMMYLCTKRKSGGSCTCARKKKKKKHLHLEGEEGEEEKKTSGGAAAMQKDATARIG